MFHHLSTVSGGKLRYQFLYTWLIYHEVLGAFSQPLHLIQHGTSSIDLLADDSFDKTAVSPRFFFLRLTAGRPNLTVGARSLDLWGALSRS